MRYDRFFSKLFCRPLLLEPGARVAYERTLLSLMEGRGTEAAAIIAKAFEARKQDVKTTTKRAESLLEIKGKTAVIHIDGAIDKHLSELDRLCFDATDLADVDAALAEVRKSSSLKNALLAINSPGGSVTGVPETAARIAELAKIKNVFAYSEGQMCSAAYWLASAADQVFGTASVQAGSIGVYLALVDESRALEQQGIHVETIKDGNLKAAGASWKPLTDAERAHFQEQVATIGRTFRAAVNAKRPGVKMEAMQGQSFFGAEAKRAGLVDALVSDLSEALAQF
ncbi:S49 family peptidase [Verrucomicrobiota bacterium sgz303538]